ncbi:hypothetical protein ACFFWE_17275 [Sphaerisporangium melleum]|nr:hypothetical protein [Sphaerisporangium melleum]
MTNQHDSFPDMMHEDLGFEVVMRGYSRRQVHDHMVRTRNQIRDLEERLARAIEQAEQGRVELTEARRRLAEAPQDYDELGQRLSAILKLAEEEAISKRETADADAAKTREEAAAEAERMLSSAQAEAERRVAEATDAAERLLAQAGSDAEETLGAARSEADETLRNARAEADRTLTAAQHEAERLVSEANAQAEATLSSAKNEAEATLKAARAEAGDTLQAARQRADSLDQHTGQRVTFLTDTHGEVMRRLNEMGSVLTDLLRRESSAGPLVDEGAVLPPPPEIGTVDDLLGKPEAPAAEEIDSVRVVLDDTADGGEDTGEVGRASGDDRTAEDARHAGAQGVTRGDQDGRDEEGAAVEQGAPAGHDLFSPRAGADQQDAHAAHRTGGPQDAGYARSGFDADAGDAREVVEETVQVVDRHPEAQDVVLGHEAPQGRVRGFFEGADVRTPGHLDGGGLSPHRQ